MPEKRKLDQVLIEITNHCNLSCKHCYNQGKPLTEMPFETFQYLYNKLDSCQYDVLFVGGGEPLLHSQLDEFLTFFSAHQDKSFVFATNGLLLTPQFVDACERAGNVFIQISVDGLTKEVYEQQRGVETFDKFKNAIDLISNSNIRNKFARTCITALNYKQTSDIYAYLADRNIRPSFLFATRQGNAIENWDSLELSVVQKLHVINELVRMDQKYGIGISIPMPVSKCNFSEECIIRSLAIDTQGYVTPCQLYYNKPIGNLLTDSLSDIDNSPILAARKRLAQQRKQRLGNSKECLACGLKKNCGYGCIGIAEEWGDPWQLDGDCAYRRGYYASIKMGLITRPENNIKK